MFFITCFEKIGDKNDYGLGIGSQRTFGFTETIEEAEKFYKYGFNRRGFFGVTDAEDLEKIDKLFAHYTNISLR